MSLCLGRLPTPFLIISIVSVRGFVLLRPLALLGHLRNGTADCSMRNKEVSELDDGERIESG
jgi:hypothetical protein